MGPQESAAVLNRECLCRLSHYQQPERAKLPAASARPQQILLPAGLLGDAVASTLDGAALMIAAGAGALAAGVPITVMPAPLLAAGGLAMYLDTDALRDYLLFVAGTLGTGESPAHVQQVGRHVAVSTAFRFACPSFMSSRAEHMHGPYHA